MELLLTEQNGHEKTYTIDKGVIRVGNLPTCDIQLPAQIGAPLQLQIFYDVRYPDRCNVFNIGPELRGNRQKLATSSKVEMRAGDELYIDSCKLAFRLPAFSGVMRASPSINANLSFPHAILYPDIPNIGTLTIGNIGKSASCQFQIFVYGLPSDCIQIAPAPLLHPDAQEQSLIYLHHRGQYPKAGFHELKFVISASQTYPGEEVMIRQQIYVQHIFQPEIKLQDDLPLSNIALEK